MKLLFELVKGYLDFGIKEVLSLYKPEKFDIFDNFLIFDSDKNFYYRLSFVKNVYEVLNVCNFDNLEKTLGLINWNEFIDGCFSLRIIGRAGFDEKKLAGYIFRSIDKPKVDLKNADFKICIFVSENKCYICKFFKKVENKWKNRFPHKKPCNSSTSTSPRNSIFMINISGINDGTLLDPFCGTAGILVEAGLIGYNIIGYDIDKKILDKAKINLKHFRISNYKLKKIDCLDADDKFDVVVTDLPYGLNTKVYMKLEELYNNFFKKYYDQCSVMVVGLPDFVDYEKLLGRWIVKECFKIYLHKNLSKIILKLEK